MIFLKTNSLLVKGEEQQPESQGKGQKGAEALSKLHPQRIIVWPVCWMGIFPGKFHFLGDLFDLTQSSFSVKIFFPHKHFSKKIIGSYLTLQLPEVMDTSWVKTLD